jgi:POT family proton-dependent oligopeptide transporter
VVEGKVSRDKVMAMLTIFVFNVLFWMFFEQAGSSFNFLAEKIVDRDIGMVGMFQALAGTNDFPVSWFQSVNSVAIIALAPCWPGCG